MSIFKRAARPETRPEPVSPSTSDLYAIAAWQGWPGYETPPYATKDQALGLPVVTGFLGILTSLILQMPLHAYRDDGTATGERIDPDPPILRNPTPGGNRTLGDWVAEYVADSCLYGDYVAVLSDPSWTGWPDVLYPVPYDQWAIQVFTSGAHAYLIGYAPELYRPDDVFHVRRGAVCTGELEGRGLLETQAAVIAQAVAVQRFTTAYFAGGAVPPAQVSHPNPELTQDQAELLKAKWRTAVQKREAVVTPAGTEVKILDSDAERAQLNDTRRALDAELAMALGIPGAMLGLDSPSLTYRNITDVFQQFVTTTVMGYLTPLEQKLTELTLPRGTVARFDTTAVLRPDIAARVTMAVQGLAGSVFTADEARAFVGLPSPPATEAPPVTAGPPSELASSSTPAPLAIVGGGSTP